MSKLLLTALILIPSFTFADTVIMRDGSQHTGTFLQGTSRVVTIVDSAGARRTFNVRDIQQVSFGDQVYSNNSNAYGSPNTNGNYAPNVNGNYDSAGNYTVDSISLVSRLRQDMSNAMNNANLTDAQYQRLQDASETLRLAAENRTYAFDVNARNVRLALDNIAAGFNTNSFNANDRQTVLDDIRQLRQVRPGYSNNPGSRSNQIQDKNNNPFHNQ